MVPPQLLAALVNEVTPVNVSAPVNRLLSPNSEDDAAVMVILLVPSKATPLMVRAVASLVAVAALPEMEPVSGLEKVTVPENT